MFYTPADMTGQDEAAIANQGSMIEWLARRQIGLVFHGHAHHVSIVSHTSKVLNGARALERRANESASDHPQRSSLVTVSCPTVAGKPHEGTPFRQYLVATIYPYDEKACGRKLKVESRIFDTNRKQWGNGDAGESMLVGPP